MGFFRRISPRKAAVDFVEEWRRPQPYRWHILGVAVAMTFALMMLFIPKSERAEPEKPNIVYITTFDPSRTDAEIVKSNEANQARKEEAQAIEKKREQIRKEFYRELGRATGLDVDEMEREAKAQEAAEAAAKAKAQRENPPRQAAAQDQAQASVAGE